MSQCKSCGAKIIWGKTANGKAVPLDCPPEKRYVLSGEASDIVTLRSTYASHFVTCPDADKFRKK